MTTRLVIRLSIPPPVSQIRLATNLSPYAIDTNLVLPNDNLIAYLVEKADTHLDADLVYVSTCFGETEMSPESFVEPRILR